MNTMQALQWDGLRLHVQRVPVPEPAPGEALIRVTRAGICNTDLEILRGYYPFNGTLGHEFVGVVETAPDQHLVGKRVVSDINASCHQCPPCLAGHPHHCERRTALGIKGRDGAFAEYLVTPMENLVQVPDAVADDQAVFAEPLAAALEIQEQVDLPHGGEVAVVGDGKLGLLITMTLAATGCEVHLVGHHGERLAGMDLGGNVVFHAHAPSRQFGVVVEATGNPAGFDDALRLTAPRGTLVLKSTYKDPLNFNPGPLVVNEITLVGSRCGPMERAVALLAAGKINPAQLVNITMPLADAVAAMDCAGRKGTLKVLLAIPGQ